MNSRPSISNHGGQAFTLVELLVVIAVVAMLFTLLVPGLCRAKLPSRVASCTANYRQWTVAANLYAQENKDILPAFGPGDETPPQDFGASAWDMNTNFLPALAPYGLPVQVWFCPARPWEFDAANANFMMRYGRPILDAMDLGLYFNGIYSGETQLIHEWWVPRHNGTSSLYPIANTFGGVKSAATPYVTAANSSPWPRKTTDWTVAKLPFITDRCYSGFISPADTNPASPNVSSINPDSAHFSNGKLVSINAGYADGHVETHLSNQIQFQSVGDAGSVVFFY